MKRALIGVLTFLLLHHNLCDAQSNNTSITSYLDFLRNQNLSAKDYILELFKAHDMVILCERDHKEFSTYLSARYKDKIASVYIMGLAIPEYGKYAVVKNGKWDYSFETSNKMDIGFNLRNSPFGSEEFDVILFAFWDKVDGKTVFRRFNDLTWIDLHLAYNVSRNKGLQLVLITSTHLVTLACFEIVHASISLLSTRSLSMLPNAHKLS